MEVIEPLDCLLTAVHAPGSIDASEPTSQSSSSTAHRSESSQPVHAEHQRELIEQIVVTHLSRLRRFLQRYERDPHDLEDLLQNTVLEAMRCAKSYRGDAKPETWLFGIALNVARGHRKRMVLRKCRYVSVDDVEESAVDERRTPSLIDSMMLRESVILINRRLESMPVSLQQTFDCMFVRGLRYREAAEELNVPVGTIRSRVSRIRELLITAASFAQASPP
ncbi:RNA polymerase sigma factor [Trinickia fusca]|nr:RNA polymerase sigma factor [Trinickia fusca]